MKRRTFFKRVLGGLGLVAAAPAMAVVGRQVLVQESPVAGYQFYGGDWVWSSLAVGAGLKLVREPDNEHDPNAVAVYFHDEQLGYVPRVENTAIAQMLDRGEHLEASISKLHLTENPWDRVWFEVVLS
jgi:hypothetical protein